MGTAVEVPKTKTSYFLSRIRVESLYVHTGAERYTLTHGVHSLLRPLSVSLTAHLPSNSTTVFTTLQYDV